MDKNIPKKEKKKSRHKKSKEMLEPFDQQQLLAKQQANILKEYTARQNAPPELAANGGENNKKALKLRLDLNLDADIQLKARIRGSVQLTLL
ncbi:hypothetical protein RMATCC62417_11805 [Rhizopus microsporus]|nr:hypothetical protein RMATCC62417_11805 [Rhizopus microsporus]